MDYLDKQIDEIAETRTLRGYGAALALTNAVTGLAWQSDQPLGQILGRGKPAVCWPFFESCSSWRLLTSDAVGWLVAGFVFVAIVNAALFVEKQQTKYGWWLLLAMTATKCAILMQDFRLTLNQHYMALWITLAFLLVPAKKWFLPRLIVAFYFGAGLLKLNHGWLSGSGLYGLRPFSMPEQLVPLACGYVVALELFIVFGLLARTRWIVWAALLQLVIFHTGSFWVVGFFYPILMFLILSIIPLLLLNVGSEIAAQDLMKYSIQRRHTLGYLVLTTFFVMQAIPRLFPGDSTITGEGRVFALNMFDAPVQCIATAMLHDSGTARTIRLGAPLMQPRLACDPIMYLEIAKGLCRDSVVSSDTFDLHLESRKAGDLNYKTVVDVPAFCSTNTRYSFWHHNSWIRVR